MLSLFADLFCSSDDSNQTDPDLRPQDVSILFDNSGEWEKEEDVRAAAGRAFQVVLLLQKTSAVFSG